VAVKWVKESGRQVKGSGRGETVDDVGEGLEV